jgi:hypothetical protein
LRVGLNRLLAQDKLFDDDAGLNAVALFTREQAFIAKADDGFKHAPGAGVNHDNKGAAVRPVASVSTVEFRLGRFVQVD